MILISLSIVLNQSHHESLPSEPALLPSIPKLPSKAPSAEFNSKPVSASENRAALAPLSHTGSEMTKPEGAGEVLSKVPGTRQGMTAIIVSLSGTPSSAYCLRSLYPISTFLIVCCFFHLRGRERE